MPRFRTFDGFAGRFRRSARGLALSGVILGGVVAGLVGTGLINPAVASATPAAAAGATYCYTSLGHCFLVFNPSNTANNFSGGNGMRVTMICWTTGASARFNGVTTSKWFKVAQSGIYASAAEVFNQTSVGHC